MQKTNAEKLLEITKIGVQP